MSSDGSPTTCCTVLLGPDLFTTDVVRAMLRPVSARTRRRLGYALIGFGVLHLVIILPMATLDGDVGRFLRSFGGRGLMAEAEQRRCAGQLTAWARPAGIVDSRSGPSATQSSSACRSWR
jgi:hypothetical protein